MIHFLTLQCSIILLFQSLAVMLLYMWIDLCSASTAYFEREDETLRERTGHPPSYAEAKKMKALSHHTHGSPGSS